MNSRRLLQWLLPIVAIILLVLLGVYIKNQMQAQNNRPAMQKSEEIQHPDVSVVNVTPEQHSTHIVAYGSAKPHYELTLTAQVSGQIKKLAKQLESGTLIKKGTTIVWLEDSDYQAAVAAAKQDLSDAQVARLEEERQSAQAQAEWRASGLTGEPASELVLRKPQLAAAQAAVANAEAALKSARKDLQNTRISVPFDALIVERSVAPGSYLQSGSEIATLYSSDRSEIEVSLSARDWQRLPQSQELNSGTWPVALSNSESGAAWQGQVLRSEQHLDATTRKRTIVISVDKPFKQTPQLLPETFLQADIPGRTLDNLWQLPTSALSQKGEIWYISSDSTLASFSAEPVFSTSTAIYIDVPEQLADSEQQVLIHPLSSYVVGMPVNPVAGGSDE